MACRKSHIPVAGQYSEGYSETMSARAVHGGYTSSSDTEDKFPDFATSDPKIATTHDRCRERELMIKGSQDESFQISAQNDDLQRAASSTNLCIKVHSTSSESQLVLVLVTSSNQSRVQLLKCTSFLLFNYHDDYHKWRRAMNVKSKELHHVLNARAGGSDGSLSVCTLDDTIQDFTIMSEDYKEMLNYNTYNDFEKPTQGTLYDINCLIYGKSLVSHASIAEETDRELKLWTFTGPSEWDPEWDIWFDLQAASTVADSSKMTD